VLDVMVTVPDPPFTVFTTCVLDERKSDGL
jgi:hypothetical protein